MIRNIIYVAAGSAAGGVCRYLISRWINALLPAAIPWGTFSVNITGSFLVGVFYGLATKNETISHSMLLLLATGFCGGFTTFSAFTFENLQLIRSGASLMAFSYIAASVVAGLLAVFLGFQIIK